MEARARLRYRAEHIWETPDDGNRYEVLDGGLFVTPPPIWAHQRGLMKLSMILAPHVYREGLGEIAQAPVGVILDEGNGVQPDIVFVRRERVHIISERGIEGAPDLVVEMLSPSTRANDRGIKMQRYAAAGVPHYWIVDPRLRILEAYRLVGGAYEQVAVHGPGSTFRPELFPGLEIPIAELWA